MLDNILPSTICLLSFLLFHKLFLENNKAHLFNRFYLLASIGLSLIIPMLSFTSYIRIPQLIKSNPSANLVQVELVENTVSWTSLLWLIYLLGLSIFLYRFAHSLKSLLSEIRSNSQIKEKDYKLVLLDKVCIPHSFLNYIFVNQKEFENGEIPESVIFHEKVHIRQKHSWDILFVEFIQVIFWFNPLLIWLKKEIQMNHEYLADKAVLEAGFEGGEYQSILLKFSTLGSSPSLSHSFHYKPLKKRLRQMKLQKPSKSQNLFRKISMFLLIPLIASLVMAFANQNYVFYVDGENGFEKGKVATEAEIKLYNRLAKYYSNPDGKEIVIQKEEIDYLKLIYANMTEEQKKNAEPFPELPEILPYEINPVELVRDTPHDPPRPPWRVIDLKYETDYTFYLNKEEATYEEILKATENPEFPVQIMHDPAHLKFWVYTDGTEPGC